MAIHSYDKTYLHYVSNNIGSMLEYAQQANIGIEIVWDTFINSYIAKQIEKGNPKYLTCSGLDYFKEVYPNVRITSDLNNFSFDCFFWAGWILAQFQYHTGYSFYEINKYLPIAKVIDLFPTLHEADATKFFDIAITFFINNSGVTNLKKIRTARGLSQSQLAKMAEVELRSIQMYEQKRNDINKAQAETLYKMAKVLGCEIEDLLEKNLNCSFN